MAPLRFPRTGTNRILIFCSDEDFASVHQRGWSLAQQHVLAQDVIAGADVSFLRQMESRGVVFKDAGVAEPGLQILKNHGYTWVRLRVMVNPITLPNTLDYTIALAKDAKARGFKLLDFHYSVDWADPGHQWAPRAWAKMSHAELEKIGVRIHARYDQSVSQGGCDA